ncbi:MAG: GC-type dockerin domain-anchored protein, partial [bacterium]
WATATQSSSTAEATASMNETVTSSGGTWTLRAWDTGNFAGIDSTLQTLTVSFLTPPNDAVQVALTEGVWSTATNALPAGGTAWFFFDLPAMPTGSVLDIDTEGSALVPANDTAIALYRTTTAAVEDQDNNDGSSQLSALSYGPGALIGAYTDSGVRFNGRDGTASGLGTPTRYYVAVVGGDATTAAPATFQTGYITVPPVANAGTVNLRVRYFTTGAPTNQTPPATPINLVSGGAWATATESIGISDVKWFTFTTPAFDATGALDIDVAGTNLLPVNDTDIALYNATGTLIDSDDTDGPEELSQLSYGAGRRNSTDDAARFAGQDGTTAGTAGNIGPNTTYFLAVGTGSSTTHATTFNTQPVAGSLNGGSTTVRVRAWATAAPTDPVPPPAGESLGNIDGNSTATDTETIPVGSVKWYVFSLTTPINALSNSALQIDTEASSTSPTLMDTSIGLYNSNGTLAVSDSSDGSGLLGTLTFGADNRPAPGDGLPYTGRDGELVAGTYYLAVTPGGFPTFAAEFAITSLSTTQSGDVTTTIRTFSPSIAAATPPSGVEAIGLLGTSTPGAEAVTTRTHTVVNGNDVMWYSFAIAGEVNASNTFYVDIDTEGTGPGVAPTMGNFVDTEIGLYSGIGALLGNDDDSGSDRRSALSFGSTTPVRPAVPTGTSVVDVARNGRNGRLIAGTYYLAVSTYNTTHNTSDFSLTLPTTRATSTGDRVVNLRTNLRRNACPNPSNVSGPGQNTVTIDEELTADDIIVFLNRFFANDLASNVSGPGQNTTALDNELTADDIIVFLNRFFAGC